MNKNLRHIIVLCLCVTLSISMCFPVFAAKTDKKDKDYSYTFVVNNGQFLEENDYLGGVVIDNIPAGVERSGSIIFDSAKSDKAKIIGVTFMPKDTGLLDKGYTATVQFKKGLSHYYGYVSGKTNIPADGRYHQGNFGKDTTDYLIHGTWTVTVKSQVELLYANIAIGN